MKGNERQLSEMADLLNQVNSPKKALIVSDAIDRLQTLRWMESSLANQTGTAMRAAKKATDTMVTLKDAMSMLGVSRSTLWRYRRAKLFKADERNRRGIRFSHADITKVQAMSSHDIMIALRKVK